MEHMEAFVEGEQASRGYLEAVEREEAASEEEGAPDNASSPKEENIFQSEDITSDEDDTEGVAEEDTGAARGAKPYTALLQCLTMSAGSPNKRRKLDHKTDVQARDAEDAKYFSKTNPGDLDEALEEVEGVETSAEDILEGEDDTKDASDPFEYHFVRPDADILSKRLLSLGKSQWRILKTISSVLGRVTVGIAEDNGTMPNLPAPVAGPESLRLKQKLAKSIRYRTSEFDSLEQAIAPCIFDYHDLLYCERKGANAERLRRLTCLHAMNHVLKTRDHVIKNNARLAKEENSDEMDLRDQGFTRPKVLMLLPTREACVRMVNMIVSLYEPEQQENRTRFEDSYVNSEGKVSADKPDDFRELFGGNDDDMFRLGMKFTRRTIKYFSKFYNSDMILASPLGLRMALGEGVNNLDYDFLSSIEVIIVDQADALLMQNWEHMDFIFDHLNFQPKEAHGCDFSRVRSWYLDNNSKYFRQTIALAGFNTPELNNLFFRGSQNWAGKIKIDARYPGALQELGLRVKQTFSRLDSTSIASDPDERFTYFTASIIPSLTRHNKDNSGTLIFIPSYLDFVRVRNYLSTSTTTSSLSFGSISEYTSVRDVARARSHLFTGRHHILLYTERAHHFRRYQLRGVRKVIMYGLPDNPLFYKEIVGGYLSRTMQEGNIESGEGSVRAVFSKWDVLKLERIAGSDRLRKMIEEKGDTFEFL
ncbi:MAG: rRNA-binding ribosome biosynthesis protein utp25 [Claussenomyces sp. TS43310]|nr:MAG: rRNA-binding ribosome biosynthesis protein utp25 [Claussenomyces sp. TS43310]